MNGDAMARNQDLCGVIMRRSRDVRLVIILKNCNGLS